jgi:hypothetical protein
VLFFGYIHSDIVFNMPTAAGYFPRVSSQHSKENICEDDQKQKSSTSSLSKSKGKSHNVSTPSKSLSQDSVLRASFKTPNRPDGAQPKKRVGGCVSSQKALNVSEIEPECFTPVQRLNLNDTELVTGDLCEQLQSLRKEKTCLEIQNSSLQVDFEQVKSQLEAVLLYKEV